MHQTDFCFTLQHAFQYQGTGHLSFCWDSDSVPIWFMITDLNFQVRFIKSWPHLRWRVYLDFVCAFKSLSIIYSLIYAQFFINILPFLPWEADIVKSWRNLSGLLKIHLKFFLIKIYPAREVWPTCFFLSCLKIEVSDRKLYWDSITISTKA